MPGLLMGPGEWVKLAGKSCLGYEHRDADGLPTMKEWAPLPKRPEPGPEPKLRLAAPAPRAPAKLGSFSGISTEILETQEGSMSDELIVHDPQVYMGGKPCAYTQASTWELIPDLYRSLLHAAISAACLYQKGKAVNGLQREENQSRA